MRVFVCIVIDEKIMIVFFEFSTKCFIGDYVIIHKNGFSMPELSDNFCSPNAYPTPGGPTQEACMSLSIINCVQIARNL
jgi:hypothetical protein